MNTGTLAQINELASERSRLYGLAGTGGADADARHRIVEIGSELEALWEHRRQEKAARRDGIDLLVDREYERIYGSGYEDAVRPVPVAEAEEETAVLAA